MLVEDCTSSTSRILLLTNTFTKAKIQIIAITTNGKIKVILLLYRGINSAIWCI